MRVRWFGESWRAPICEPEYQVIVPVGTKCLECTKPIKASSQGLITSCSPSIWGSWMMQVDDVDVTVCSYHLHCWLKEVVGGEMSAKILARMDYRVTDDEIVPVQSPGAETVEPGRGWGRERDDGDDS